MKYVIGVDFGTLSGRAVLVETTSGCVVSQSSMDYKHGVMNTSLPSGQRLAKGAALAHPDDYIDVLVQTVSETVKASHVKIQDIIGIAVDATTCSLLPVDRQFKPLCTYERFKENPHAYIKLWKHHSATEETDRLNYEANSSGEPFLRRAGWKTSCEWVFPKLLETVRHAPEVYTKAAYFFDLCDWLTSLLCGKVSRSWGAAGYKALWSPEEGYPNTSFLKRLSPQFFNAATEKLAGEILPIGSKAGPLSPTMAELLGLPVGIAVATGSLDGHSPFAALGVNQPGDLLLVIGTSSVSAILSDKLCEIEGICGVVRDGMVPGFYGYDSGQNCVGDLFDWFVKNCVPPAYHSQARRKGITLHALLEEKSIKHRENGLLALDWWNGNRSMLADMDLTGCLFGLTLDTKPEDIYLCLIEAAAFGLKRIIQGHEERGIAVNQIYACGGISMKSPYMMQIYADVLGQKISVSTLSNAAAVGAAIYAAAAAEKNEGGFGSLTNVVATMAHRDFFIYQPQSDRSEYYNEKYAKYCKLYDLFGKSFSSLIK